MWREKKEGDEKNEILSSILKPGIVLDFYFDDAVVKYKTV